jgi:hypothetical protein
MINTSFRRLVFNLEGQALDVAIRKALQKATDVLLSSNGLEHVDLNSVTTKTHVRATFAKFVRLKVRKHFSEN